MRNTNPPATDIPTRASCGETATNTRFPRYLSPETKSLIDETPFVLKTVQPTCGLWGYARGMRSSLGVGVTSGTGATYCIVDDRKRTDRKVLEMWWQREITSEILQGR